MARLASVEKAGFYPTPPEETELVCSRLTAEPGSKIAVFDPCCGEGIALEEMAKSLQAQGEDVTSYSYGVELEEGRARKAHGHLDRVICSPYEDATITPHSFPFMWLNPPYMDFGDERAEVVFLRDLTDPVKGKLQPGGLLGFCIPEQILKQAALLLAVRFQSIKVYRFTEKSYPAYRQIVVFGYRREKRPSPEEFRETKEWLCSLDIIPRLNVKDGMLFNIPPSTKEVLTFKSAQPSEEEVMTALQRSSAWKKAEESLPQLKGVQDMQPPILPLKTAHIAVAIAAGAIGGSMGNHLLVGKSKKVVDTKTVPDEKGITKTQTERVVTTVRVFSPDGVFDLK
jgi:hypothetical protein